MVSLCDAVTDYLLSTPLQQARGAIARRLDPGERLIFDYDDAKPRLVHMLGVRQPLRVTWYIEGSMRRVEHMQPWRDVALERADCIIEEPI